MIRTLGTLALAIIGALAAGDTSAASPLFLGAGESVSVNLDVAALVLAGGTLAAGVAAWKRLRLDRPKIVEEVAALHEGRLRAALDAAWAEADRLRQARDRYVADLGRCHDRIDVLERRESDLEGQLADVSAELARLRGA